MATLSVAYNPTSEFIATCSNYGQISVGKSGPTESILDFSQEPGGIRWWKTPNYTTGTVVCLPVPTGNQPNDAGGSAYVGFYRAASLSEEDYVYLTNYVLGAAPNFTCFTAGDCNNYIQYTLNGWSSYPGF